MKNPDQRRIQKHLRFILNKSDVLLEVIDIRMPRETRIYKLEKLVNKKKKPLILVLNKADLVPEDFAYTVKETFEQEFPTVFISSKTRKGSRTLRKLIKEYSPEDKDKVYVGLFGMPNTGKSSVINVLVGRHRVGTAPIPGFTKGVQLIKLSSKHYLIDSPGVYYPSNKYLLAILGAIPPERLEYPEKALKYLLEKLPKLFLEEVYNFSFDSVDDLVKKIAEKYNIKSKDWRRKAAERILNDWIKGRIKGYWF